jgi:hypothetical protein
MGAFDALFDTGSEKWCRPTPRSARLSLPTESPAPRALAHCALRKMWARSRPCATRHPSASASSRNRGELATG